MARVRSSGATIPRRQLGGTGESISVIGIGGIVLMGHDRSEADAIMAGAIDAGVDYVDVAPSYGDGEAEEKTGEALIGRRDSVFLACKTARRDREGARHELERSLQRLRTDHVDLYQLHGLTSVDEVHQAVRPGGALGTIVEAKAQGLLRFIGFSAHTVEAALAAMDAFPFDTVLFPFNWACWIDGSFGPQVCEAAAERNIGRLALKSMAWRNWPDGAPHTYSKAWYEPIADPALARMALRFTLSQPITAAIPPGHRSLFDVALTTQNLAEPLSSEEMDALLALSRGQAPLFAYSPAA